MRLNARHNLFAWPCLTFAASDLLFKAQAITVLRLGSSTALASAHETWNIARRDLAPYLVRTRLFEA
jgi:hypothetical protein